MKKHVRIFIRGSGGILQDVVLVDKGANLRTALLESHRSFLYHKKFSTFNCHGLGSCGTCALKVEGLTTKPSKSEFMRLALPPHRKAQEKRLRLACQTRVLGDIWVDKLSGYWGQGEATDIKEHSSLENLSEKRPAVYPKAWHIDPKSGSHRPIEIG